MTLVAFPGQPYSEMNFEKLMPTLYTFTSRPLHDCSNWLQYLRFIHVNSVHNFFTYFISLTLHHYVWHPESHCGNAKNQLTSNFLGGGVGYSMQWSTSSQWLTTQSDNLSLTFLNNSRLSAESFPYYTGPLWCLYWAMASNIHGLVLLQLDLIIWRFRGNIIRTVLYC